jgi:hypothetical protein
MAQERPGRSRLRSWRAAGAPPKQGRSVRSARRTGKETKTGLSAHLHGGSNARLASDLISAKLIRPAPFALVLECNRGGLVPNDRLM